MRTFHKPSKLFIFKILLLIFIGVFSYTVLGKKFSSPDTYQKTIQSLDDKRKNVLELAAASAGVSTALTLIPGDTATPIADQLADLSKYFMFILCAILLEKYLVTITGYAAFYILIPLACAFLLVYMFWKQEFLSRIGKKLLLFSFIIVFTIPGSVKVSNLIENTYSTSMNETIQKAKNSKTEIEQSTSDSQDDEKGFFSKIASKVKDGVSGITDKASGLINNFIEAIAVLIVTSCLIPLLVLVFFVWLAKSFFGISGVPSNPLFLPLKKKTEEE